MVLDITLDYTIIAIQHFANRSPIYHQVNTHNYHLSHHYVLLTTEPSPLDKLPPNFLRDVEAAGDRLVAKAAQLVQIRTTNITENFMSIRCKMDGGKYYNRIQSGSFQHPAALRVQFGPGWTTPILSSFGIQSTICDEYTSSRKRKHDRDTARKITLKYKKQRLMTRYGQQTVKSLPDPSYGSNPAEPDVPVAELKHLCQEYLIRLQV